MSRSYCALCECRIDQANFSREHIIPNAIGGRKVVIGFICRDCNSDYGATWDAALVRQLNPMSLFFGINRQHGEVPSQILPTLSGGQVQLNADGTKSIAKPEVKISEGDGATSIQINARSRKELRHILRGMRRKYPQIATMDLDSLVANVSSGLNYSNDPMKIVSSFGGHDTGRALVKTALAAVFDAGCNPRQGDLALEYLLKPKGEPCFGYYYDQNRDLVTNRPLGIPLHCVSIKGSKHAGTLLGYVEIYGIHRIVLCLSKSYVGRDFTYVHAIDPIIGEELDVSVDLEITMSDIRAAYEYETVSDIALKRAIANVFDTAVRRDFDRGLKRAIHEAVQTAFANCEAQDGDELSDSQIKHVIDDAINHLEPFIYHNREMFGFRR